MARTYGADVIKEVKELAEADLNNNIDAVATERSDTGLEKILKFNVGVFERQYPECVINLGTSKVETDEMGLQLDSTTELYPVEVLITLRDNTANIAYRMEYYIEALMRTFYGYQSNKIAWIIVDECIRANAYTEKNETLKVVGVALLVQIV